MVTSITVLPTEVLAKCLASLTWTDLARAACVNRLWQQLVRNINNQPVWQTDLWELHPDHTASQTFDFVATAVRALEFGPRPDLCCVIASSDWAENLSDLSAALSAALPPCTAIVGCCGTGVIGTPFGGTPSECEEGSFVSIALIHLPPSVKCKTFQLGGHPRKSVDLDALFGELAQDCPASTSEGSPSGGQPCHKPVFFVMSDYHEDYWIKKLHGRFPGAIITGGVASSSPPAPPFIMLPPRNSRNQPIVGSSNAFSRMVGVALWGPGLVPFPFVIRGKSVVSPLYCVKEVKKIKKARHYGTLLQRLQEVRVVGHEDGMPQYEAVGGMIEPHTLAEADPGGVPFGSNHIGVAGQHMDGLDGSSWAWDDFLRYTVSANHQPFLPGDIEVGSIIAGLVTDEKQGKLDLHHLMNHKKNLFWDGLRDPKGGGAGSGMVCDGVVHVAEGVGGILAAVCCARGEHVYDGKPNVEAQVIRENFPGVSVTGLFANGEIGPNPYPEVKWNDYSQSHILSFSSVYLALKIMPPNDSVA